MELPRLYAVTDENVIPNHLLLEKVGFILDAGVRMLQVRFKKTPNDEQVEFASRLRRLTRLYNTLLIINDSVELAAVVKADGVHLGKTDPPVEHARTILGPSGIIGVSCYDRADLVSLWKPGDVAYIGLSSPYKSPTKDKATPNLDEFARLVSQATVPVYSIGGITPERVPEMINAGCYGIAAVSAIFGADDSVGAVRDFLAMLL